MYVYNEDFDLSHSSGDSLGLTMPDTNQIDTSYYATRLVIEGTRQDTVSTWQQWPEASGGGSQIIDTFTDSDGITLASHTPESGSWTLRNGSSTITINSNHITASVNGGATYYYNDTPPTSADYTVSCNYYMSSASQAGLYISIRNTSSGDNCYFAQFNGGDWVLRKVVSGSVTQLGSYTGLDPTTMRSLSLSAVGSTITVSVDDTDVIVVTDTDIASAGYAGVVSYYCDVNSNNWIDNLGIK
jgi:hypothetical protein